MFYHVVHVHVWIVIHINTKKFEFVGFILIYTAIFIMRQVSTVRWYAVSYTPGTCPLESLKEIIE